MLSRQAGESFERLNIDGFAAYRRQSAAQFAYGIGMDERIIASHPNQCLIADQQGDAVAKFGFSDMKLLRRFPHGWRSETRTPVRCGDRIQRSSVLARDCRRRSGNCEELSPNVGIAIRDDLVYDRTEDCILQPQLAL